MLERIFELAQKRLEENQNQYGEAEDCFGDIAICWGVLFGVKVTAKQVPMAMIMLKVVREKFRPKLDNRGDMAGYAACLDKLSEKKDEPPAKRYTEADARKDAIRDLP